MTTTRNRIIHWGLDHGWSVQGLDTLTLTFERYGVRISVQFTEHDTFVIARQYHDGTRTEIGTLDVLLYTLGVS